MEVEVRDLLGLIGVVRDPDGDDVLVGEQVGEIGPQRLGQGTVQGGEGLIDQEQTRPGRQRPGDGHPLTHTSGEPGRREVSGRGEAHPFQPLGGRQIRRLAADHQGDVAVSRVPGHEPRLLEYLGQAPRRAGDGAGVGVRQARDRPQQCGLAGSGGSGDRQGLSRDNRYGQILHQGQAPADHRDVIQLELAAVPMPLSQLARHVRGIGRNIRHEAGASRSEAPPASLAASGS